MDYQMVSFVITVGCIMQWDRRYVMVNLDFFAKGFHSLNRLPSFSPTRVEQFQSDFMSKEQ